MSTMHETGTLQKDHQTRSLDNRTLNRLILVCCHGTYNRERAVSTNGSPKDEDNWILQSFQKSDPKAGKQGEHLTFIKHIEAAVDLIGKEANALLVFSGGKTQNQIDVTEAQSYLDCCEDMGMTDCDDRMALDTRATDSYQNLLFSILVFRRHVGSYPKHITVVTHAFKEQRFLELHAQAIQWPKDMITVLGIDPPFTPTDREETLRGEMKRGYDLFANDLYGTRDILARKRADRGWDCDANVACGVDLEPEVQELLAWDGGTDGKEVFPRRLPWQHV